MILFVIGAVNFIYYVLFLIDAVLEKQSSIFVMPVKYKRLPCKRSIDTSHWCLFEVSIPFVLAC